MLLEICGGEPVVFIAHPFLSSVNFTKHVIIAISSEEVPALRIMTRVV